MKEKVWDKIPVWAWSCAAAVAAVGTAAWLASKLEDFFDLWGEDSYGEYQMKLEEAYRTLEIEPSASDEEVKRAYREMALRYHPDRVKTVSEEAKRMVEKRFQEINAAKELIYRSREIY